MAEADESAPLCGTHGKSRYWISTDICGWICALLCYTFMAFASYTTYAVILRPWPAGWALNAHMAGYYTCMLLAFLSHLKTMLTNPGAVPKEAIPLDFYDANCAGKFQPHHNSCNRCKSFKPQTSHHCSTCNRCIVRMDHHCPWANNCIGQNNHKFFILFVSYTFIACLWTLYLIVMRTAICGASYERDPNTHRFVQMNQACLYFAPNGSGNNNLSGLFLQVMLGVEAVFFGLFTMCMICDASSMFSTGHAQIDQMKKRPGATATSWSENFASVFGGDGRFSPLWLLPVEAKWKNADKQLGYMLPLKQEPEDDLV